MVYQLSFPGYIPTRPETVKDSITAYLRDPTFWKDFVSFDFYGNLRNVLDKDNKKITKPFMIQWFMHALSTADRMMDNADCSISLLSDNSKDGLLNILESNLIKNHDTYLTNRVNIRIISLNENDPGRFKNYNSVDLVQSSMAASPSRKINPLLVCYSTKGNYGFSSLEIQTPLDILSRLSPENTYSIFYPHGNIPKMHQDIFDLYWRKLNNIPEREKPKSLGKRILEKLFF